MATQIRYPKGTPFFDNNGAILASGTITYYQAGTTTLQSVYSDADGLVALPNPVTLNSAGRAVDGSSSPVAIYLKDGGTDYKEVIKNASGTTLYTDDDIPEPVDPTASLSDFAKPLTEVSTDTSGTVSLTAADFGKLRLANTASGSITYNLPSAAAVGNGKPIGIKKTSPSNSVTLDASGSDVIDGGATYTWMPDDQTIWITSDGANWQVSSSSGGFARTVIQSFTTPGANTYTPTTGMKSCLVMSTGAGGGGGGADSDGSSLAGGAGGGAGGTCIEVFSAATIGTSQTVTIGAGGTAGADTGGNGGNGGDTTFGALHTAGGGPGGTGIAGTDTHAVNGVAGGTATGGLVNIPGGMGGPGLGADGTTNAAFSGLGGASFWGGGARSVVLAAISAVAGVNGAVPGSGGSGAANRSTAAGAAGGVGADGICVVIEFI
jgi:hypothetical protein